MKVQCGQCPAKYAVADDRIRDKKVRILCKRCNAAIVVDGKSDPPLVTSTPARPSARPLGSSSSAPDSVPASSPEVENDARISPRPVAHTIMGGLEAPAAEALRRAQNASAQSGAKSPRRFVTARDESLASPAPVRGLPTADRGTTDPPVGANANRWRVALTKEDLRWMTTEEITAAYQSGAVKLETFVFRAGMPTWLTLLEVPEIVDALADGGADVGRVKATLPEANPLSPSSMPPPRKGPFEREGDADALEGGEDHLGSERESDESMPFALVSERGNGVGAQMLGSDPGPGQLTPHPSEPSLELNESTADEEILRDSEIAPAASELYEDGLERPSSAEAPVPVGPDAGSAPHAAPSPPASSSGRWIWISLFVLLSLAAAAYFLGRRFGFQLPLR